MNEEAFNLSLRKFLKRVGIASQREIELAVRRAVDSGALKSRAPLGASMQLRIPAIGLDATVDGSIDID